MKISLAILLTMSSLMLIASCGRSEDSNHWDYSAPDRAEENALSKIQSPHFQVTHLRVRGTTPGTVALSMLEANGAAGFCSGSLISPRHVLTNRHCIPMDLSPTTGNCTGRVFVSLPGVETVDPEFHFTHNRPIDCKSIDYVTQDIETQPEDLAILTLSEDIPQSAKFRTIHLRELKDGESIDVNRVNFIHDSKNGQWSTTLNFTTPDGSFTSSRPLAGQLTVADFNTLPCGIAEGSRIVPEHFSPYSSRYTLGQCPVIPGNSGALVTDARGDGVAVLFAENHASMFSQLRAYLAGVEMEPTLPVGIATNLECGSPEFHSVLAQFRPMGSAGRDCRSPNDPNLAKVRAEAEARRLLIKVSHFAQANNFAYWLNSEGTTLRHTLGDLAVDGMSPAALRNPDTINVFQIKTYFGKPQLHQFYLPTLRCVKRADRILSQTQKSFLFIKWQPTSASIELPPIAATQLIGVKLDSSLRLQPKQSRNGLIIRTRVELDAKKLEMTGATPYRWILEYEEMGRKKQVSAPGGMLNTCL